MSEWDTIAAADRYANRQLRRMEAGAETRSLAPVSLPAPGVSFDRSANYGQPGTGFWDTGMAWKSGFGVSAVNDEQASRVSAVFGCWRILSDAISTLPLSTFTRKGGVRTPFYPVPRYLSFEVPQQGRIAYLCQVVLSLLCDGNAYVATPRDDLGEVMDLIVLQPDMVQPYREGAQKLFKVGDRKGYTEFDIMHIAGMLMPGALCGVSPIQAARDSIDQSFKAMDYGRAMLANHATPPAVIEVPADTSGSGDPERENRRAQKIGEMWNQTHGGASNAGKVGILTGGASLKTVSLSPEDAQWLDSRRFGVQEIARFYGVPPHLLADSSNSTSWGSGLAEQNLAFGQFSLRPLTERIEEGHTRLESTMGRRDVFVKLNLDALLRASLADRYASYAIAIEHRFMTPNECRKLEDLPPLPGGDVFPDSPEATAVALRSLREEMLSLEAA